ncbi:FtsX-like permease family protein [Nocardioides sp.]|uniref:FtsX-like permease family protein n=1 Tax=Nocardioides sp. TaxID=35761 RepID=UPI00273239B7|nr:FtsX-like permease family protein [Nocardioides sp.]MDP3889676.1 hypothetical protein [Nocardioides sp.]
MTALALRLLRAGGATRSILVAGCTAAVTALLLVVVTLALLPASPDEQLFSLVAEKELRFGTAFSVGLLTVPPLLLLHQAVRIGTATRERRLASLRLAGATTWQVRRLGTVEVGIPALAGSLLGVPGWLLLRGLFGGIPLDAGYRESGLQLVPRSVTPDWWLVVLVVGAVSAVAVLVGLVASRGLSVTPLGVSRRQALSRPPRASVPALVLLAAAACLTAAVVLHLRYRAGDIVDVLGLLSIALAVAAAVTAGPWIAHRAGRLVAARATSPALLLGARRLVAEPRAAGRAAAAVGGIGLVAGGGAAVLAEVILSFDRFFMVSYALAGTVTLVALLVVTASLTVHAWESMHEHRRSVASLAALGATEDDLVRSQRWEAALASLPLACLGVLVGGAAMSLLVASPLALILVVMTLLMVAILLGAAIIAATSMTRPLVRRGDRPGVQLNP